MSIEILMKIKKRGLEAYYQWKLFEHSSYIEYKSILNISAAIPM